MRKVNLQNIVYKDDKYYVAQCLNIDVSSFGKTKKEALAELQDALNLYLSDNLKPKIQKISRVEHFGLVKAIAYA